MALSVVAIKAAKGRAKPYKLTDRTASICWWRRAVHATGG